jgi:hypothetical protein
MRSELAVPMEIARAADLDTRRHRRRDGPAGGIHMSFIGLV